ncbi:MAG: TlpA family protein disulfide reductase, partial [Rubrivivax sp.]|nr:TlpA family protein disulfide reductase [Pyrinomonadaceae bacterium]
ALLLAACVFGGTPYKMAGASWDAPAGSKPPRTSLPMPPIEPAHKTAADAATPRGAWTQLDGRRAGLEDLRGQVVILDFWATYCAPCREEIPHLVRLQREFGPQGFKVIGLNVGGQEDRPRIPDFVKQYGIQYQLAEPDDETVRLFLASNGNIPQTFVLDRRGKIILHIVGYDGDAAAQLDEAVRDALSEKAD